MRTRSVNSNGRKVQITRLPDFKNIIRFKLVRFLIISIATTGALLFVATEYRSNENSVFTYNYENTLGTSFQLKVHALSEKIAVNAKQVALNEIDRLSKILSTYDQESEVSKWLQTQDQDVKISPDLYEVLSDFEKWNQRTSGALNPSVAEAIDIWKQAEDIQELPNNEMRSRIVNSMNRRHWILDHREHTARHLTDKPLVLNSFVKSYIIGRVSDKLLTIPGVNGVVTNIGGDIVIAGSLTEDVQISNPLADAENDIPISILKLHDRTIATSGNYRRGFKIGDTWYSHIFDPRTAMPVSHVISATVIAPDPVAAGALATAFNVLSPDESESLASTIPDVEYLIITKDRKRITSRGWHNLEKTSGPGPVPPGKNVDSQNMNQLEIAFELARFSGRFRRPFVAVWIENGDKEPVRTLALWYDKPRWLPDLKRWYSKNQSIVRDYQKVSSISSATRSPGQYTLAWDGISDEGELMPPGKYTVYIEAAREHGTYQLIKQEIDLKDKAKRIDLKGGIEITSASLTLTR